MKPNIRIAPGQPTTVDIHVIHLPRGVKTPLSIVAILREADREPIGVVAKRHGISEQTIYTWRKRFGTFQADDVRRLKRLEAENARLKKLVAERDLEIEVMKEITAKKW